MLVNNININHVIAKFDVVRYVLAINL